MTTWNTTAPDGNQSVKANESILQDNTTFIETTMGIDHFWDEGGTKDGHHQFVQVPATNVAVPPAPIVITNPTLAAGMDGVYYARFKTTSESVAQQDCQPYFINDTGVSPAEVINVLQLLGMRACALFNSNGVNGIQTLKYSHNCTINRINPGSYRINFATALPSDDYLVLGGASSSSSSSFLHFNIVGGTDDTNKSTLLTNFITTNNSGTLTDPFQAWIVVFGG